MNNLVFTYLRKKRGRPLIRVASVLTVGGITLAVISLLTGLSVFSGFKKEYLKAVLNFNAPLVVMKVGEMEQVSGEKTKLENYLESKNEKGVVTPFLYREGLLVLKGKVKGVVIKGVDLDKIEQVSGTKIRYFSEKKEGLILGEVLARSLGVAASPEKLHLFLPEEGEEKIASRHFLRFPVAGVFESGMYDYDAGFAFLPLAEIQKILKIRDRVTGFEIWPAPGEPASGEPDHPEKVLSWGETMRKDLGYPYSVMTWYDLNKNIFEALRLQKLIFTILLGFLVLVASFNLTGILVMKMLERRQDIAIFRAFGAGPKKLRRLFFAEGFFWGGTGLLLGTILAFGFSRLLAQREWIPLSPEVYFISSVPSAWSWGEALVVFGVGFLFLFGAVWFSLSRLSRLNLVRALTEA